MQTPKQRSTYESFVGKISQAIITTAERISESIVSIILALVAVISAIPEFWGLWEVSGEWMLGIAIAAMGAAGAHAAVMIGSKEAWAVLAGHVAIAEFTILWYGGGVELLFPFITIVGALIMSLTSAYAAQSKELAADKEDRKAERRKDKEDRKELERQLKLLRAEAEADAIRNGVTSSVTSSVTPSVTKSVTLPNENVTQGDRTTESSVTSSVTSGVAMRHSRIVEMLHSCDTPDDINKANMARQLGVSRQTIVRDIKSLESSGKINLNGKVTVIKK